MEELVICSRDAEANPNVVRQLEERGYTVVIARPEDIAVAVQMRDLVCNAALVLEQCKSDFIERDFGKRGKKGKRKKDWHR